MDRQQQGAMGATRLLAGLLASAGEMFDRYGDGIGASPAAIANGVASEVQLPSGDRYAVIVQWLGDREGEAA